ncbi:hypothetical protein L0F63_006203 [Massospora cicadina]|nr:hypothetical protein L0F63_006203 [Massospora cicadina]
MGLLDHVKLTEIEALVEPTYYGVTLKPPRRKFSRGSIWRPRRRKSIQLNGAEPCQLRGSLPLVKVGDELFNDVFYEPNNLMAGYNKLMSGHLNLSKFSTHPSDHPNFNEVNPGGLNREALPSGSGPRVLLGRLNSVYDSPITAFACSETSEDDSAAGCEMTRGDAFMVSGHADGSIVFYRVRQPDPRLNSVVGRDGRGYLPPDLTGSENQASPSDAERGSDNKLLVSFKSFDRFRFEVTEFGCYGGRLLPALPVYSTHRFPVKLAFKLVYGCSFGGLGVRLRLMSGVGRFGSRAVEVECTAFGLGNRGRIQLLKIVRTRPPSPYDPASVVLSVADTGEVCAWDPRDGRCLATFHPTDGTNAGLIDNLHVAGNDPKLVLCAGPGQLFFIAFADLKLVSNLSREMLYAAALPLPACGPPDRVPDRVPVLVLGPSFMELLLGEAILAGEGFELRCRLPLGMAVSAWRANIYAPSPDRLQVLLVSPTAFVVVQVEHQQAMRQLTQQVPPPTDDAWADGFFLPDRQLVVTTLGGGISHYRFDAVGGLVRVGERTLEPPHPTTHLFSHLRLGGEDFLVSVDRGNSQLVFDRVSLPPAPPNPVGNPVGRWRQALPKPGEAVGGQLTCQTPITLEVEGSPKGFVAMGFRDGTIRIAPRAHLFGVAGEDASWRQLTSHRHAVTCLYQPSGLGSKQLLLSGDAWGGIRLWELSSWVRLASFLGHSHPVHQFFQLPSPAQFVFGLARDASLSVFCLKRVACLGLIPGHRAPVAQVRYAESVLEVVYGDGNRTRWNLLPKGIGLAAGAGAWAVGVELCDPRSTPSTAEVACYPVWDVRHPFPALDVFDVDVRGLLHSVTSSAEPSIEFLAQARCKRRGSPTEADLETNLSPAEPPVAPERADAHPRSVGTGSYLAKVVFHALLAREAVTDACGATGGLGASQLLFGVRGAGAKVSFMLRGPPSSEGFQRGCWTVSPYATASRLLPLVVMAKAFSSEAEALAVVTDYGCRLPELVGGGFQFPCLGYLAKFWRDASMDIHHVARSLFLSLFNQLGPTHRCQLVAHWVAHLPQTLPVDLVRLPAGVAALALGILMVHHPDLISEASARTRIARSLEWLLSAHSKFRRSAMHVIATKFQAFEAHVDGVWILRCLYDAHHDPDRQLRQAAQQAAVQIALANTPLFITSLGLVKGSQPLGAILQLISRLVPSYPAALSPHLPRIVEVIVKALHPRDAEQRHALIAPATQTLHDLVGAYAAVAFHPGSQRLAVGVSEGAAIVYNLYTATRSLVVEGYHSPVTAVAFSPTGRYLATFSSDESVLKVWSASPKLFEMLAKTFRGHPPPPARLKGSSPPTSGRASPTPGPPDGTPAPSPSHSFFSFSPTPYRTFNTGLGDPNGKRSFPKLVTTLGSPGAHPTRLKFAADRTLQLEADGLTLTFNI